MAYICFDTESGGLGRDVSLLTAYFAVFDEKFNQISELDLKLIPDDGIYKVQPRALGINQIDLQELEKEAITYKEAKTKLYTFLSAAFYGGFVGTVEPEKLIPIGQNVQFDINFIFDTIISQGSWENFVSHRALDTMYIANFLKIAGKLPLESVSLVNLVEYFGISVEGNPHEAKYDALATVEVFKKLKELVK